MISAYANEEQNELSFTTLCAFTGHRLDPQSLRFPPPIPS